MSDITTRQRQVAAKLIQEEFASRIETLQRSPCGDAIEKEAAALEKPYAARIKKLRGLQKQAEQLEAALTKETRVKGQTNYCRRRNNWQDNLREQAELNLSTDEKVIDKERKQRRRLLARVETATSTAQLNAIYKAAAISD